MLNMTFTKHSPLTPLEIDMIRFVNDNIIGIIDGVLDFVNARPDENLPSYFPRGYYSKNGHKCKDIIYVIRDILASGVIYPNLKPLYSHVLYRMLEDWIEATVDLPEMRRYFLPETLEKRIVEEYVAPYEEGSDEYNDGLFLIDELEDIEEYIEDCFEDDDFLEENIRTWVELAMSRGIDYTDFTYEEFDEYIEVMPVDVAEKYMKFREVQKDSTKLNVEDAIVLTIQDAMKKFSQRVTNHRDKKEVELTADLQEKIEDVLSVQNEVAIAREYTLGRAIKQLGETDLYFFMKDSGRTTDIAVLENKDIDNFRNQYMQLMGYLNPYFKFGITVSINKKLTLAEAISKIERELWEIEGDFAVTNVCRPDNGEHYLMSEHIVPETGEKMRVYHFILNLNDESRKEAAEIARGVYS